MEGSQDARRKLRSMSDERALLIAQVTEELREVKQLFEEVHKIRDRLALQRIAFQFGCELFAVATAQQMQSAPR